MFEFRNHFLGVDADGLRFQSAEDRRFPEERIAVRVGDEFDPSAQIMKSRREEDGSEGTIGFRSRRGGLGNEEARDDPGGSAFSGEAFGGESELSDRKMGREVSVREESPMSRIATDHPFTFVDQFWRGSEGVHDREGEFEVISTNRGESVERRRSWIERSFQVKVAVHL